MSTTDTSSKPLIIIVHGVGRQLKLETLRAFIEGSTADFEIPSTLTRAQLADQLLNRGVVAVDGLPVAFQEFNYANTIENHQPFAEQDPRTWIKAFRNRLREMNRRRGGPDDESFAVMDDVADDVIFATTLTRLIADRLKLQTHAAPVASSMVGFLQQVQLYLDCEPYRDEVNDAFQTFINTVEESRTPHAGPIVLVAHSLGTVVCLRAILSAASKDLSWLKHVSHFTTFGSPIDLVLLLFPELFEITSQHKGASIKWVNYSFGNDPIASDLAIARQWVRDKAPGLFEVDDPTEVDLGPGTMTAAHTDYWHDNLMLSEIYKLTTIRADRSTEAPASAASNGSEPSVSSPVSRSTGSPIGRASLIASAVAGWLIILWWEENIKTDDAKRVVLLTSPLAQLLFWVGCTAMVVSHVKCWSVSREMRYLFFVVCCVTTLGLIVCLPGLQVLGEMWDLGASSMPIHILDDSRWQLGNLILLLVPITAGIGATLSREFGVQRQYKSFVISLLAVAVIALSLFVGTRDNPSNAVAEFTLISLTFGIWWLSILLSRIDQAYKAFIGGREHLNKLSRMWNVQQQPIRFLNRAVNRIEEKGQA